MSAQPVEVPVAAEHAVGAAQGGGVQAADAATGVVVRMGNARYAVPMAAISEVGRVSRVTRVPGVPIWVPGVSNWRGRILPIVDLRSLLGASTGPVPAEARVVVCGDETVSVGLLVEGVEGVTTLPAGEYDAPPATVGVDAVELLAGQWTDERGPIGIVDVAAVLRLRSRLPRERRRD